MTVELLKALEFIDWGQVVANGGPPCFHVEDGQFCLRAERWAGHGKTFHHFVSMEQLLTPLLAIERRYQAMASWAFRGTEDNRLMERLSNGMYRIWNRSTTAHSEAKTIESVIDIANQGKS